MYINKLGRRIENEIGVAVIPLFNLIPERSGIREWQSSKRMSEYLLKTLDSTAQSKTGI